MAALTHRIERLAGPEDVLALVANANRARSRGQLDVRLTSHGIFPNAAVPVAAALAYYRRDGQPVRVSATSDDVDRMHIVNPLHPTKSQLEAGVLSRVWEYRTEDESMALCDAFVDAISENANCSEGVLDSINWCLYEVMDNVFQHSRSESGFAMMQIHKRNRWAAISVADTGIGIHRSFREGGVYPVPDAYEALMLAVQERVTSKPKNMGNGLYGLMRVVGLNRGSLEIRSGRGWLHFGNDGGLSGSASQSQPVLETSDHHGTSVDWQVNLARQVSMTEALGRHHVSTRLEALEDEDDVHRVRVADFEEGLGTRRSAEQVRTKLVNLLNDGLPRLRLDFEDVNVVSSSFADEVLGKLALQLGDEFDRRFVLLNMSATVESIVGRAIEQRLAEGDIGFPGVSTEPVRRA